MHKRKSHNKSVEVVAEVDNSRISLGTFPLAQGRALAKALKKNPGVIHQIKRWFMVLGTSEIRISRTMIDAE